MAVSWKGGTPIAGWFRMDKSGFKMDKNWGYLSGYLYFRKPAYGMGQHPSPGQVQFIAFRVVFFTCNPIYFQCSVLLCCFVSGASSLWLSRSLVSTCVYMFLIFFGINLKFAVSVFPPRGLHFFACENHTVWGNPILFVLLCTMFP